MPDASRGPVDISLRILSDPVPFNAEDSVGHTDVDVPWPPADLQKLLDRAASDGIADLEAGATPTANHDDIAVAAQCCELMSAAITSRDASAAAYLGLLLGKLLSRIEVRPRRRDIELGAAERKRQSKRAEQKRVLKDPKIRKMVLDHVTQLMKSNKKLSPTAACARAAKQFLPTLGILNRKTGDPICGRTVYTELKEALPKKENARLRPK